MIHSMTAFARQEYQTEWGVLICEIRSINHRYLECAFKLPEHFVELELSLRELLKRRLQRGKVDMSLRIKTEKTTDSKLRLNEPLLEQLISLNQDVQQRIGEKAMLNTMHLLSWPNVIQQAEVDLGMIKRDAMAVFEAALTQLMAMRQREGKALLDFIEQRLIVVEQAVQQVKEHLPQVVLNQRTRIKAKLAELVANFNAERLEQEMVLFVQRIDVEEELNRLETHVQEVRHALAEGGPQGRRLDFLMQELNREANTLGVKAGDVLISSIAISLKVLIEQMREQVQNIE